MSLSGIVTALSRAHALQDALKSGSRSADFSLVDGLRAPLVAGLLAKPRAVLVIAPTSREGEAFRRSLESYAPDAEIVEFPAWETLPHERLSPSAETVGRRITALRGLAKWAAAVEKDPSKSHPFVLVASVRAALQPLADNLADIETLELVAGARGYDLAELATKLVDLA